MTFFLCTAKLYYISVIQGVITFQRAEFESIDTDLRLAFLFGFLLFGNIIDNSPTPKLMAILLQFSLAIVWTATGLLVNYIVSQEDLQGKLPDLVSYMMVKIMSLAQVLAAGLILINILQVYNWFTTKHICTMLALYFLAQFLGYMTPINFVSALYWSAEPIMYYIGGVLFILFAIIDIWAFQFNPLQINIFLDQETDLGEESKAKLSFGSVAYEAEFRYSEGSNSRGTMQALSHEVRQRKQIDKGTFDALN